MNWILAGLVLCAPAGSGAGADPPPAAVAALAPDEQVEFARRDSESPGARAFQGGEIYISLSAIVLLALLVWILFMQHN